MSAPAAAGTLAAQSGGTPSPQRHQQLGGSHPHTPPLMRVTAQEARKPEGDDETLAPAHPISRAGPEVSEDEGEGGSGSSGKKKKKQRSMAELIKGLDLNLGDDGGMGEEGIEEAAPTKGEEEAATTPTTAAAEVEAPPSPTTAAARKRKKDGEGDSESDAKGFPASPPTADPEANQALVLPDGGVSSGRRERKKSKYLSPPYTMVIEKKPSFSSRSASGDALDLDGLGGVSSPLAKCSSFGRKKEAVDLELPFVFDESTPSVAELLAELRCASVGVMYLVASRHGSAVRGCFTLFRTYSYTGITGGNKAPVEETKPSVPAPVLPIAVDNKALQQQDNGGDTNNFIKTPVSTAENKNPEEANKSALGKRNYNKRKSAPAVLATTTEANGGVEEPKTGGRPKKKNKEKEDKSSALDNDGYGDSTPTPTSAPAPAPSNNTPAALPFPAPAPSNNTPAAVPFPAPAPSNKTLAAAPAPAPASSHDIPAAAPAPVVTQLQTNGGSSTAVVPEQEEAKKKKKRKRRSGPPGSASLILTFAPGADLPTKDHLLGFFSRYGVLDEARTEVRAATRVACVAYAIKADAQRAIASPDRDQAFGPGVATFRIKYARQARQPGGGEGGPVSPAAGVVMPTRAIPRLPLEFVKKNLESMIAALELCRPEGAGSGVPATGPEVETDPRNELVDQMSNLLTKVNKLLADGSASGSLANGGVDATTAAATSTTAAAAAGGLTA